MTAGLVAGDRPLNVTVTGAAGNIAYAILFMIGSGQMAGPNQKINLCLLDIPQCEKALVGVEMEIRDCAFPCINDITCTSDYKVAFTGCDVALLIGAKPRGPGMVRADLLRENGKIFKGQGEALNKYASASCKILVVGNPANTNALIAMTYAPNIPRKNFTAMTRLDQNRAEAQVSGKIGMDIANVNKVSIWGNHSASMFADIAHGDVGGRPLPEVVDEAWFKGEFVKTIAQRGKSIITARGKSSAASAAKAAVDHMRDWLCGTPEGKWSNMGVVSDGNSYGVPEDLIFSFPCVCRNGEWRRVEGLPHSDYAREKIAATTNELVEEKRAALGN
jgi:malate dehydrogenase